MKSETDSARVRLYRLVRRFLPHREWFVMTGGYCFTCTPGPTLRWVWMGDPISMSWSGFGPFDSEEEAQQAADEMQAYHEATSPNAGDVARPAATRKCGRSKSPR